MLGAGMSVVKLGLAVQVPVIAVFWTVGIAYSCDTRPFAVRKVIHRCVRREKALTIEKL